MTSPALIVLFLAHACSIFGTASEQAADHDSKLTDTHTNMRPHHAMHNVHNLWTNIPKNLDKSNSKIYINNKYDDNNKEYDIKNKYDDIYTEDSEVDSLDLHGMNLKLSNDKSLRVFDESKMVGKKRYKREDSRCDLFLFNERDPHHIMHPHQRGNKTYYSKIDCTTVITAKKDQVIHLTFVDEFRIENHPDCVYDYLEIRDGLKGYAKPLGRFCGTAFPPMITTSGPYAWVKFHSDDTIEYEGFKINIDFKSAPSSQSVPESCYINTKTTVKETEWFGEFDLSSVDQDCKDESPLDLDILWKIETPENTKIYLNFTKFKLATPNECELNVVEVFGSVPEMQYRLAQYCGSIANSVSTKGNEGKEGSNDKGNIMHVRLMLSQNSRKNTEFSAQYTAYRTLNPNKDEKCTEEEFDCDDNTCVHVLLRCDGKGNCRLKTDEDVETCKPEAESTIKKPHIMVILIIFSLILSAMSFVFLFKCFRKLYQDHKIIKEHIRESCEDRLDMVGSRLTLDAKRLQRDSEPRASLERENQANEMYKRKRDSFSKRKPTSIDSDYIQETHLDLDEEPWRREVDSVPMEADDIRVERNGRTRRSERERQDRRSERASERASERQAERQAERRSDISKKEESIRSKRETEEREREKREIRDVSVGAPDTKESGCQTRESLFQEGAPPSSDGSGTTGTNSRGFSTFGYSGATIARPSPPATNTSEIKIELLRQVPRQDSVKPQKKSADRRPISTETTRSAPDVIIVSKPIR